jgi:transposase, IS30 family
MRKRYSPDQVAGRLRLEHPVDETMHVSREAIYTWIHVLPVGELADVGCGCDRAAASAVPHRPDAEDVRLHLLQQNLSLLRR